MATWTSGVNNGYSLRMNAYEIGVNQAANSSTVRIDLWLKVGTQSFYGPMFVEARCGGEKQKKNVQNSGAGV